MSASHRRTARARLASVRRARVRRGGVRRRAATSARAARAAGARAGAGVRAATAARAGRPAAPGARRPGLTRRPPGTAPPPTPRPPRRPGLTSRAAVLALVVCALVLLLAYPMRTHLGQRARVAELQAESADRGARVAAFEEQIARWDDPEHVEAEARRRLHYVHPGETLYTVLTPGSAEPAPEPAAPGVPPLREQAPWWGQLWHSAQGSDAAPVRSEAATR